MIDGVVVIDRDYYNTKEEQFKQVMVTQTMVRMMNCVTHTFSSGAAGLYTAAVICCNQNKAEATSAKKLSVTTGGKQLPG